ncbi:UNVERIFIED_CONTAM: hypothetical protein RMT77_014720 [Armadillidium vulgare]
MDFNADNASVKIEIKNEEFEDDCNFDPEFWYDFDRIKKEEEEEVKSEVLDDEDPILNFAEDYIVKIEDINNENKVARDQFDKISHSKFPVVLLQKLDVNIHDKVHITGESETDCVIKIYRSYGNDEYFEEGFSNENCVVSHQNCSENFTTSDGKRRRAENMSHAVGQIIEGSPKRNPQKKVKKVKEKQLKTPKTVDEIKSNCKLLKCYLCNYKTNIRCNLKRHLPTHIDPVSTYYCSECEYFTRRKDNLKIHFLNHYEGQFKCFECSYETSDKRTLNRHILIHLEKKLFKCSFCDFRTNYKTHLKTHEFNHSGKKKFFCSECKYKTNFKKNLIRHVLDHSGMKAYKCHDCGYQTNDVSHLKRHKNAIRHKKAFPH